uniref:Uncharacterized protein n=1 Tax=Anguilla anguilla TaxID=7936 RepID=A0A0E9TLN8_ANGAN
MLTEEQEDQEAVDKYLVVVLQKKLL